MSDDVFPVQAPRHTQTPGKESIWVVAGAGGDVRIPPGEPLRTSGSSGEVFRIAFL